MNSQRREARPANGGQFLLNLLQNPTNSNSAGSSVLQQPSQTFAEDPAVASVGPSIDSFTIPRAPLTSEVRDFNYRPWNQSSTTPFVPHVFFQQNPNLNPDVSSQYGGFGYAPHQVNAQSSRGTLGEDSKKFGSIGDNSEGSKGHKLDQSLIFGSFHRNVPTGDAGVDLNRNMYGRNEFWNSSVEKRPGVDGRVDRLLKHSAEINGNGRGSELRGYEQERVFDMVRSRKQVDEGTDRTWVLPPPGFSSSSKNVRNREDEYMRRTSDHKSDKGNRDFSDLHKSDRLSNHIDSPGLRVGSSLRYGPAVDIGETRITHNNEVVEESLRYGSQGKISRDGDDDGTEIDDSVDHLADILELEDVPGDKNGKKKHHRDKDYRSDNRGQWIMGQRMRNVRRHMACRSDVYKFDSHFLEIFNSLIPAEEEKAKQKQLLAVLEQLVVKEWPDARLYLYGSCANSFGFPKSDLDVCLVLELGDTEKSEVILKLADILQSGNLENVQALTRARVPIVKLMDPVTNISCDICVNNVLAVVNTKLLRDYARIDERLRQLAFIVKHWAKSRGVNETYRGTLSSYAYVLMCIHFLQQRRPPILPCLQGMNITYFATVDNVECGYFDQVDKLHNFGSRNRETIAQLVWSFFHYWAYCHDYASDVISVRTGSTLSKKCKDWTRRVGNDRHLICIEDPFELSHDLGRVVDKFTIRVLREEFERAAEIMHHHSNPCARLFEPYVPN